MQHELAQEAGIAGRFDDTVRADKLRLLFKQSYPGLFVSMIVAILLCWVLWDYIAPTILLTWFGILCASTIARLALFLAYSRNTPQDHEVLRWATPYIVTLLSTSLIWGIGVLAIMPKDALLAQAFTQFVLIGMAGGVLATYSALRPVAIAAMLSMLLPSTIWMYFQNDKIQAGIAIGATIFIIVTLRGSKILADALHDNFQLGYELKHAHDVADTLAKTDVLTGLNNRRAFFERGEQITRYCERHRLPISAMLIDVDHFKHINDTYGHHCGDMALSKLGEMLKQQFRKSDVLGRLGGEEFAILLPNTHQEEAASIAELLRQNVSSTPIIHQDQQLMMTASIGIASGSYDLTTLLPMADAAMYKAKTGGRNRVVTAD